MKSDKKWFLYIIRCADDSLYTGITTDLQRRVREHNSKQGAKAVKGKLPVVMIYSEDHPSRSAASKREFEIKSLTREEKIALTRTPVIQS